MQRHIFLLSLVTLCVLPAASQTQSVSPDAAALIAAKYIDQVVQPRSTRGTQADDQPYYIFNDGDGEGFVIVAKDKRMNEVVGRSVTGVVNMADIPPALQVYLDNYTRYVQSLDATAIRHSASSTPDAVAPLLSTKWDQGYPYNKLAPQLGGDGQRPPIGCVATAVSQVMNYHKWPLRGKGEVRYEPGYQSNGQTYGPQYVNFEQSVYHWDKMTAESGTAEAEDAVSKLMYDVSVAVHMDYSPKGSGATMTRAADALREHFDYDTRTFDRDVLPSISFIESLRYELRAGYPVIFSGNPEQGDSGHAWVCDGFDQNGLFSMNWGWGGMSDGYFDLSYLNPNQRGAGGGGIGGYCQNQKIICVRPKREGERPFEQQRIGLDFNFMGTMRADKTTTTRREGLQLSLDGLGNFSSQEAFLSHIGVGVFRDLDEEPIHVFDFGKKYEENSRHLHFGSSFLEVKEQVQFSDIPEGVYYLYPLSKTLDRETTWHKTIRPCYLKIRIAGEKVEIIERSDKPSLQLMSQPQGAAEVPSGRTIEYKIHLTNPSVVHFRGNLQVVLSGQGKEYVCQPLNSAFRFMDNTSERRTILVSYPLDMPTGEYEMSFRFDYTQVSSGTIADGNKNVAQAETPFKVKVWNTENNPHLQHIGTYIIEGNMQIADEQIDISQYPNLQIFVRTTNVGKEDFQGELSYLLEDIESQARFELKRMPYEVSKNGGGESRLPIIDVKDYLEHFKSNHRYRLIVEAHRKGEKVYDWTHHQILTLLTPTAIAENEVTVPLVEYRSASQTLHVNTQQPLAFLSVYTINGSAVLHHNSPAAGEHNIDMSELPMGTYLVVLHTGRERKVLRIVR